MVMIILVMKMLLGIIVIISALFIFTVLYFFSIAFVRHDDKNIDDIDASVNSFLGEYKPTVKEGIDFIERQPHSYVYCHSFDNLKLAARYYDCKSEKTVILFHGYRSSAKRDFSCAVKMYCEYGYNVLLADQRSHGKSEGRLITFGVKERNDVLSWVNYILENTSASEIYLGGMSMGATTVLLSAGLPLPDNVKGIIADCGFTSPVSIIKKVARQAFKINAGVFIPFMNLLCRIFGGFSLYGVSTTEALSNSKIPVLFIHGMNDNFVPCEMSRTAYETAGCEKNILLVDGADHGMSYLVDTPKVKTAIEVFLTAHG